MVCSFVFADLAHCGRIAAFWLKPLESLDMRKTSRVLAQCRKVRLLRVFACLLLYSGVVECSVCTGFQAGERLLIIEIIWFSGFRRDGPASRSCAGACYLRRRGMCGQNSNNRNSRRHARHTLAIGGRACAEALFE
jgi:hypothetical protein